MGWLGEIVRERGQFFGQRVQGRQHDLVARGLQHHAVRGVVDVFGGAGEVDEFGRGRQFGHVLHLLLEPVFDRLDVVVGDRLDGLDAFRVGLAELGGQLVEQRRGLRGKRLDFREAGLRQRLQPGDLDFHAVVHETGFGQDGTQRVGLGGVAAVERRQGEQGGRHDG
jgi:hypothetical protein